MMVNMKIIKNSSPGIVVLGEENGFGVGCRMLCNAGWVGDLVTKSSIDHHYDYGGGRGWVGVVGLDF